MGERVSQEVIEAAYAASTVTARTTEEVIEVAYMGSPTARATQLVIEVAYVQAVITDPIRSFAVIVG